MTGIRSISTRLAPAPGGHYAQGVSYGGLLFVSGQLPVQPGGSHAPESDFETQCRRAFANVFGILAEAGSSPERVLKVTAYIVGAAHWPAFNHVYAQIFGESRPARSVVPVPELHYGYMIEVEAIAALPDETSAAHAT